MVEKALVWSGVCDKEWIRASTMLLYRHAFHIFPKFMERLSPIQIRMEDFNVHAGLVLLSASYNSCLFVFLLINPLVLLINQDLNTMESIGIASQPPTFLFKTKRQLFVSFVRIYCTYVQIYMI